MVRIWAIEGKFLLVKMLFLPFSWVEFGLGKIPLVKRFFVRELKRASCVEGTDVFGAALVGAAVVGVALTGIAVA